MRASEMDPAPQQTAAASRERSLAIAAMAAASLSFPFIDAIAKWLAQTHSPIFLSWARYLAAALVVLLAGLFRRSARISASDFGPNLLRTALASAAMTCFFLALPLVPLAQVFGGFFVAPVVAAVAAVPMLGERPRLPRSLAVLIGFAGVLLIVGPAGELSWGSLLAVASGVFYAAFLLVTRIAAPRTPAMAALRFQLVGGTLLLMPAAFFNWSWPSGSELGLIAVMGCVSALGQLLLIAAFRRAEASMLSPLAYLELVSATALGLAVFHELPTAAVWAGIALIVAGGLLLWRFEAG